MVTVNEEITATIGVVALGAAGARYFITNATRPEQLILFAGSLGLIKPGLVTDIIGFACLLLVFFLQKRRTSRKSPRTESQGEGTTA